MLRILYIISPFYFESGGSGSIAIELHIFSFDVLFIEDTL